ncbi:MAG: hypothetical protein ACD_15C00059G0002 [uncultured bacterium]|nr:MAG: hypothetical protein ACD_15C00059G0002 [uncultured bacterium]HCU70759.1 hypothetical protein [Candidatus Moranbacteria bacterium]
MLLSKKIFITSSSILLITLLFWGIYIFSFKKPSPEKEAVVSKKSDDAQVEKTSIVGNEERIQKITDESVISPILSDNDESMKYYSKSSGKVYQLDLLTLEKKVVSDANLIGLLDVYWSPNQGMVISKFSSGAGYPKFSFFDYLTKKASRLNESIGAVSWQSNKKIIYTYFDNKNKEKSINISDPNGENWNKITTFSSDSISIAPVPKSGFISFWNKPDSFSETLFQSTPIMGGETKVLSSGVFGADYLWNSDGTMFLRSNVDQKGGHKMELGFANSLGGEYKNIGLPTFVSKCVWSKNNSFVFCALPGSISEKNILPNDYLDSSFTTNDTFWKVNLKTGEKTRVVPLEELKTTYDATGLFLSYNESYLFFVNKIDDKLYRIRL